MADLFMAPPLPQTTDRTSYSVDLYNAETFVTRTVRSLVCPFDSGQTSSYEKLFSVGTSVLGRVLLVQENPYLCNTNISVSIGSRDANSHNPLLCNKDTAVTRMLASVLVVSAVTNHHHFVSPQTGKPLKTLLMLPDCLAFE